MKRTGCSTRRIVSLSRGLSLLITCVAALSSVWAEVEPLGGREIAQRVHDRYIGDDISNASEMRLINARGDVRSREFLTYRLLPKDGKRTLIKFWRPADIKDTGNLAEEVKGADDLQYLYLPASKKLRRVSSKNQSWVGSDFLYEDLQELELDDYAYGALAPAMVNGIHCYGYTMVPLSPEKSAYGKQVCWVRVTDYVPVRTDYYDKKQHLLKIATMSDFRETAGIVFAWETVMQNVQDLHRTELRRRWILVNTGMEADLLTTRQLEKSIEFYDHPSNIWALWKSSLTQQASGP